MNKFKLLRSKLSKFVFIIVLTGSVFNFAMAKSYEVTHGLQEDLGSYQIEDLVIVEVSEGKLENGYNLKVKILQSEASRDTIAAAAVLSMYEKTQEMHESQLETLSIYENNQTYILTGDPDPWDLFWKGFREQCIKKYGEEFARTMIDNLVAFGIGAGATALSSGPIAIILGAGMIIYLGNRISKIAYEMYQDNWEKAGALTFNLANELVFGLGGSKWVQRLIKKRSTSFFGKLFRGMRQAAEEGLPIRPPNNNSGNNSNNGSNPQPTNSTSPSLGVPRGTPPSPSQPGVTIRPPVKKPQPVESGPTNQGRVQTAENALTEVAEAPIVRPEPLPPVEKIDASTLPNQVNSISSNSISSKPILSNEDKSAISVTTLRAPRNGSNQTKLLDLENNEIFYGEAVPIYDVTARNNEISAYLLWNYFNRKAIAKSQARNGLNFKVLPIWETDIYFYQQKLPMKTQDNDQSSLTQDILVFDWLVGNPNRVDGENIGISKHLKYDGQRIASKHDRSFIVGTSQDWTNLIGQRYGVSFSSPSAVYNSVLDSDLLLLIKETPWEKIQSLVSPYLNKSQLNALQSRYNSIQFNGRARSSQLDLSASKNTPQAPLGPPKITQDEKETLERHILDSQEYDDSKLLQKLLSGELLTIKERRRLSKIISDLVYECRTNTDFQNQNKDFCAYIKQLSEQFSDYTLSLPEITDEDLRNEFGGWLISDEAEYQKIQILLNWSIPGTYLIWGHGTPYRKNTLIRINGEWVDFKTGKDLYEYLINPANNTGYVPGTPIHFVVCHGGVQNTGTQPVFATQLAQAANVPVKPYSGFVYSSGIRGQFIELAPGETPPPGVPIRTYNKSSGKPINGWIKEISRTWGEMPWIEP
ncbi:MAG TPA: hypothetical protein PKC21_02715 [Oligoflexia bacterium]|nr:hypothetical protein [Oligoflexia bacterium]HMR24244.1 hypothetical protein [Oligoflexia bacterium]